MVKWDEIEVGMIVTYKDADSLVIETIDHRNTAMISYKGKHWHGSRFTPKAMLYRAVYRELFNSGVHKVRRMTELERLIYG